MLHKPKKERTSKHERKQWKKTRVKCENERFSVAGERRSGVGAHVNTNETFL